MIGVTYSRAKESEFHDALAMAKSPSKSMLPENVSEFAVTRDKLLQFFDPPIGKSTFHDLVNRGKIIQVRGLRGYYCLNESLVRMGMKPVKEIPDRDEATTEDLVRLALNIIDPTLFPTPDRYSSGLPSISEPLGQYLVSLVSRHGPEIEALEDAEQKVSYGCGMIEGAVTASKF